MMAATWWDHLASELTATAVSWRCITAAVCAVWTGPSSIAMLSASTSYASWLASTAVQAERTASQARSAAAAFEAARAASVPPPLVAANRAQLAALVATNLLGQNTAAIMALEAAYAEMWAQDVAAMAEYQAASAAATGGLPQFDAAPQVTNGGPSTPGSGSSSGAAVSGLLGSSLGDLANQYLQAFLSSGPYEVPISLLSMFNVLWAVASPASPITQALNRLSAAAEASVTFPPQTPATPSAPPAAASSGTAGRLGRLSAPSWATQPDRRDQPAAAAVRALPAEQTAIAVPLPAPMPGGGTPPKQQRPPPEYGAVVRFVPRPPSGG
ncbi:PPE family protein [Mycobacterium sp. SMC-2]|uniref:PPE family protein n=1 Tax=Mycobacterium sp. SMC-2 TaxID=2857058 RepID=UPI0021B2EC15|nr:PPE family protein [Mycobacterium sp. SMC-2]